MKAVKKVFGNYLLLSAVCIVLGAALIAKPEFFTHAISYTIGGLSIAAGVIEAIRFLLGRNSPKEENASDPGVFFIVRGVILVAIGIFLILKPDFIAQVLALMFGLYMLISGAASLFDSMKIKKANEEWQLPCLLASLTLLGGIVILFNPMLPNNIMFTVLGIVLLASGITNLIGSVIGKRKVEELLRLNGEEDDGGKKSKKNKRDFIDID